MKKVVCIIICLIFVFLMNLPIQAQMNSNPTFSRPEDFMSVDGRPMKPGAGAERFLQKALSRTFKTKIKYSADEFEDETSCRIVARENAKQNLVEKISDDVVEYYNTEVSNKYDLYPLVREEIYYLLFNLLNFETTKDKWKNNQLNLEMEATTNTNDIIQQARVLNTDKPLSNHMMKNRKLAEDAFEEVKRLKKEAVGTGGKTEIQRQYKYEVNRLNATDCFEKGLFAGFSGENQSAIDAFARVIEFNPNFAPAYYYRGVYIFSYKKDPQSALSDFNKAIELDDADARFFESRGICYSKSGNKDLAMRDFKRGIELNPSSASLLSARAAAYEAANQYQNALEDYSKAIEINPEDLRPHYRMGLIFKKQEKYQQCIEALGKAIEINDQIADAFYERALAYAYLKDDKNKEKIIDDFKAAAKLGHSGAQDVLKSINVTW